MPEMPGRHLWEHESLVRRFESAWRAGATPHIPDFLPADPAARREVLVELACTDLEYRLKAGQPARVEEYRDRFPELADATAVLDLIEAEYRTRRRAEPGLSADEFAERFPRERDRLSARLGLGATLAGTPNDIPQPPAELPPVPGYEVLSELGRGGMGVVYLARQLGLNRTVALKMISAGRGADAEARTRFRAEAEAVAALQHPNIVQVFEVGEADGRPFFSMEYVAGGSLADRLDGTPLPPAEAAALVEAVAQAMDAAHQRGVVHRDLKPANILLQSKSEIRSPKSESADSDVGFRASDFDSKVSDFGLAKRLEGGSGLTHTGMIVGTPSYMAPEQAGGRVREVGPVTDVYALGAILYEALTGRPPFKGATAWDTMKQVLTAEPVAPARLQPGVPRDLETVCLKCLEKEPARRYPTAAALADDLGRFRRGEPVLARPVGSAARLWRWARRNPWVAGLTAALFAALAVGLGTVTGLWRLAETRRETAEAAGARAARARDQAHSVLDDMTSQEALDWLTAQRRLLPQQSSFLERALGHYRAMADEEATDDGGRALVGRSHARIGVILHALGRTAEAEPAYRQAAEALGRLAEDHPADPAFPYELANVVTNRARLLSDLGQRAEAGAAFREAVAARDRLANRFPREPAYRLKLADALRHLGAAELAAGRPAVAVADCQRAADVCERLVAEHPREPRYRHEQAVCLAGLANVLAALNRPADAEAAYRRAETLSEPLVQRHPTVAVYRQQRAACQHNLAQLLAGQGRGPAADAAYRAALADRQRLADSQPGIPAYREELADTLNNYSTLLAGTGRRPDAVAALRRAAALYEHLAADQPTVPGYREDLARSLNNLGNALTDLGQRADADTALRQARDLYDRLVAAQPATAAYREGLGITYYTSGKHAQAADARAAIDWYGKAIATLGPVAEQAPRTGPARLFLARAHWRRADALDRLGRHAEAIPDWDSALKWFGGAGDPQVRAGRVVSLARAGDHGRATAAADALAREPDVAGAILYECARVHALAAAAGQGDAARAVELLRSAAARGFTDLARLKTDRDFAALLDRADVRALVGPAASAGPR